MTHISTSVYMGLLISSPLIFYELFVYISPALYDNERKYSKRIIISIYLLFILGILISYFIVFPISFRFLGTYSVDERVTSTITLDSYISSFICLTLLMGVVFQLPIISYILGKMGLISYNQLQKYRKHAIIITAIISAIITPPDIFTLILVSIPIYVLYELSILVLKNIVKKNKNENLE